jgi:hypothetical protein
MHRVVLRAHGQPMEDLSDDPPVHQVARVKDLDADEVEVRGHEIEIVPDADDVGIGVVRVQDGVSVGAIALVAPGKGGFRRRRGRGGDG